MGWLSLVNTVLGLFSNVAELLKNRRLINAGKAEAKAEANEKVLKRVQKAKKTSNSSDSVVDIRQRMRKKRKSTSK